MNNDIYSQGKEIQKRIILTKMATILHSNFKAEDWMNSPQYTLGGKTPNGMIEEGSYEWVLQEVGRLQTGCY